MQERIGQPGARPLVDVFGQSYTQAVSYRHIQDGLYVAVPPFTKPADVENAIGEIKQWMANQIEQEESHDEDDIESDGNSAFQL